MSRISCCYNCSDRVVGCHGKCEKYIAERKKLDEYNDKVFQQTAGDRAYAAYHNDLYHKLTNKKQWGGYRFRSRSI